jgi:lysophospholipase L1-like esterase
LYENEDIAIRWYSDTKSITLSGDLAKEFEEKLNSMASISQDLANEGLPFVSRNEAAEGVQTTNDCEHSLEASFKLIIKQLESRMVMLSEDFLKNTLAINNTLLDHSDQINGLKNQDKEKLSALEIENHELKVQNSALEERMTNLTYILADLQGKLKNAEEEKASLITVIRLLNNNNESNDCAGDQIDANSAVEQEQQNQTSEHFQPNIPVKKSYMVLNVEETINEPSISESSQQYAHQSENTKRVQNLTTTTRYNEQNPNRAQNSPRPTKYDKQKQTVAILGDSMIKHMNKKRLQNGLSHNIKLKTFPGATAADMAHYVKPALMAKPDVVILHVGTNDIKNNSPEKVVQSICNLGKGIRKQQNKIDLILSSIITRNDDPSLATKVTKCNKLLNDLCIEQNWGLVDNSNIDKYQLNSYCLHLNTKGSASLAKNIKNYLKNIN